MLLRRVGFFLYCFDVSLESRQWRVQALHEIPDEARGAPLRNTQHVVKHENLAVDMRTCADAYDRNIQSLRDRLADLVRHAFEQHQIGARTLQGDSVLYHLLGSCAVTPLHAKAADFVDGLGLKTHMGTHWNIMIAEALHDSYLTATAF